MADIDARAGKTFDFAADLVKQLITLSTAVFGVTVTFAKDIVPHAAWAARALLTTGWFSFLVSLVFGVLTLMQLSGQFGRPNDFPEPTIYKGSIQWTVLIQFLFFLIGLIGIATAALVAL